MFAPYAESLTHSSGLNLWPSKDESTRVLSVEIIELIADSLFEPHTPTFSGNIEHETICCIKPHWNEVKGFLEASPELHRIGFRRWVEVLTIRSREDWDVALAMPLLIRYD
jgi:hypothetical protein